MSDIEIHIKANRITYDATFDVGDADAAAEARQCLAFILDLIAGPAPLKARAPRTAARKPTAPTTAPTTVPTTVPPKPATSTDSSPQR